MLEILLSEHRAMGAYEILDKLREMGHASQPPVAYRALEFLVSNGFAHRIEKLNAFVACNSSEQEHNPTFLICGSCGTVSETASDVGQNALGKVADQFGFKIESSVVEAEGLCPQCRDAEN